MTGFRRIGGFRKNTAISSQWTDNYKLETKRCAGILLQWFPAVTLKWENSSLQIKLDDGRVWRQHLDHVKSTEVPQQPSDLQDSDIATAGDPPSSPGDEGATTTSEVPTSET